MAMLRVSEILLFFFLNIFFSFFLKSCREDPADTSLCLQLSELHCKTVHTESEK